MFSKRIIFRGRFRVREYNIKFAQYKTRRVPTKMLNCVCVCVCVA